MKEISSSILKSRKFEAILMSTATSSKKTIIETTNQIKQLAANEGLLSLSATQIGSPYSIFVMLQKNIIKPNQFFSYKQKSSHYSSFINPKILDYSVEEIMGWEQCSSYPNIRFKINRSTHIIAEYEKTFKDRAPVKEQFKGFQAIAFQHQYTHTKCTNLFDMAQDIQLTPSSSFSENVRQKLNEEFTKFKIQRDQDKIFQLSKQIKLTAPNTTNDLIQTQKQQKQINDETQNRSFTYSQCKSLRDFIQFEIIDPV